MSCVSSHTVHWWPCFLAGICGMPTTSESRDNWCKLSMPRCAKRLCHRSVCTAPQNDANDQAEGPEECCVAEGLQPGPPPSLNGGEMLGLEKGALLGGHAAAREAVGGRGKLVVGRAGRDCTSWAGSLDSGRSAAGSTGHDSSRTYSPEAEAVPVARISRSIGLRMMHPPAVKVNSVPECCRTLSSLTVRVGTNRTRGSTRSAEREAPVLTCRCTVPSYRQTAWAPLPKRTWIGTGNRRRGPAKSFLSQDISFVHPLSMAQPGSGVDRGLDK